MANFRFKLALILLLGTAFYVTPAWSGAIQIAPDEACNLLADAGLRTRGGYRETGSSFHCRSQWRAATGGSRADNSIRFLAQGTEDLVTQLNLELRVNARAGIQRAHRSLADRARTLMRNALNTAMPDEIEGAILAGVRGSWSVQGSTVTLERISAPGTGYELRLRIQ